MLLTAPPPTVTLGLLLVLGTSQSRLSKFNESTETEGEHMGLIRPRKDLSIWIDEDQVCRIPTRISLLRYVIILNISNVSKLNRLNISLESDTLSSMWWLTEW